VEQQVTSAPSTDEANRAHVQFSELVAPLLDRLAAYTGYELSLLAGQPRLDKSKLNIEVLRCVWDGGFAIIADTYLVCSLDFSQADAALYTEVMRKFSRFVWGAHKSCSFIQKGRPL
jgi:formate-dependent nitrite reductase membrane component NrfD